MKKLFIAGYIWAFCLVLGAASAASAGTVTLKKAFIEKYKNRATIDASFIVDHAHPRPNPPKRMAICMLPGGHSSKSAFPWSQR